MNRSLRHQFVCGISNSATRKKLQSEDRTFQQALEVVLAHEIAEKDSVQVLQQLPQSVDSVSRNFSVSPSSPAVDSVFKNSAVSPYSSGNSRVRPPLCQIRLRLLSRIIVFRLEIMAGHVRSKCSCHIQEDILLVLA